MLRSVLNDGRDLVRTRFVDGMTRAVEFGRVAVGARAGPPLKIGIDDPVRPGYNGPARLRLPGGRSYWRVEDSSCRQYLRSRLEVGLVARQVGGEVLVEGCRGEEGEDGGCR